MFNQNENPPFLDHNISIIEYNGKVISKPAKTPPDNPHGILSVHKKTDYFENELSFIKSFNDAIFKIQGDSVCIKYNLDFGYNSVSRDFFNENKNLDFGELYEALNKIDVVNIIDNYNEISNFLFFTCNKKGKHYQIYYNKQSKARHIFDTSSFPKWSRLLIRPYMYSDDNIMISVLHPSTIDRFGKKYINEISENKVFSKLESTIVDSDINDNPSLIVYYLK